MVPNYSKKPSNNSKKWHLCAALLHFTAQHQHEHDCTASLSTPIGKLRVRPYSILVVTIYEQKCVTFGNMKPLQLLCAKITRVFGTASFRV